MAHILAGFQQKPLSPDLSPKKTKLYNLYYRGQIMLSNQLYVVCRGKQSKLKGPNFSDIHFQILPAK